MIVNFKVAEEMRDDVINMSRAQDKEKIRVLDRKDRFVKRETLTLSFHTPLSYILDESP